MAALGKREGVKFVKNTRATYWNPDRNVRVTCAVSKRYDRPDQTYWYAYHPRWDDFLTEAERGFFLLGCVDQDVGFAIPKEVIQENLTHLRTTTTKKDPPRMYWHIGLRESGDGSYELKLPRVEENLPLKEFIVEI